jgi:hypothetical protein
MQAQEKNQLCPLFTDRRSYCPLLPIWYPGGVLSDVFRRMIGYTLDALHPYTLQLPQLSAPK